MFTDDEVWRISAEVISRPKRRNAIRNSCLERGVGGGIFGPKFPQVSNKETAPHENVYRIAIVHRYSGADLRQGE